MINTEGNILVVNQNGNSWSLPKGHVEDGESPLMAAKREINEESGISELSLVKELGTYERHKIARGGGEDPSEKKRITMFLFTTRQMDLQPIDPDNPEARWVSFDDAVLLLTHPKDKAFLESVRNAIGV